MLTVKQKCSRQNQTAHSKTKKLTAKPKSSQQNQKAHGKTKQLTAKPKDSQNNYFVFHIQRDYENLGSILL